MKNKPFVYRLTCMDYNYQLPSSESQCLSPPVGKIPVQLSDVLLTTTGNSEGYCFHNERMNEMCTIF